MELETLKENWRALDARVGELDERLSDMAAAVVRKRLVSASERLRRRLRLGIVLCCCLPLNLWTLLGRAQERPGIELLLPLGVFVAAVLVRQLLLLDRLRRIDPLGQSVREASLAAVRFRRCFVVGVAAGVCLVIPLLVGLGLCLLRQGNVCAVWGFVTGLAVGVPIGVRVYLKMRRDVDLLQQALDDLDA